MKCDLPFGGKCIVLGGDFRRILLVIPGGDSAIVINATINITPMGFLHCIQVDTKYEAECKGQYYRYDFDYCQTHMKPIFPVPLLFSLCVDFKIIFYFVLNGLTN